MQASPAERLGEGHQGERRFLRGPFLRGPKHEVNVKLADHEPRIGDWVIAVGVQQGRVGSGTEERVLAIMFTDIVSFTSTCERMSAAEVAEFINQHLSLVSLCVEQEGGTIDNPFLRGIGLPDNWSCATPT
jgi:class 3 adenylate cyclase